VYWDATLEPTQVHIDAAIVEGEHPIDHGFGRKVKK
jgi:hypothetical protein